MKKIDYKIFICQVICLLIISALFIACKTPSETDPNNANESTEQIESIPKPIPDSPSEPIPRVESEPESEPESEAESKPESEAEPETESEPESSQESSTESAIREYVFYNPSLNHNYSAYQTAHTVYEYCCKDLGDSYYEVITYKLHYFAASSGGHGATHYNNGAYRSKNESQLVDIVRQGNTTPDFIEKHITTSTSSKTITDFVTGETVVLYIPTKIKYASYYYGITKK